MSQSSPYSALPFDLRKQYLEVVLQNGTQHPQAQVLREKHRTNKLFTEFADFIDRRNIRVDVASWKEQLSEADYQQFIISTQQRLEEFELQDDKMLKEHGKDRYVPQQIPATQSLAIWQQEVSQVLEKIQAEDPASSFLLPLKILHEKLLQEAQKAPRLLTRESFFHHLKTAIAAACDTLSRQKEAERVIATSSPVEYEPVLAEIFDIHKPRTFFYPMFRLMCADLGQRETKNH